MDVVGFLACFIAYMAQVFGRTTDPVIFAGAMIGIGLCAIAAALHSTKGG